MSTLNSRDNAQNAYLTAALPNPFSGLFPASAGAPSSFTSTTISRQQLLRPYPQFGDINTTSNFLDTSALAKLYHQETGSEYVELGWQL